MADDSSIPEWTNDDLKALAGLPVRYEGRDDWVITGRSPTAQAVEITNGDGAVAYIGPVTVFAGEAVLLDAQPDRNVRTIDWPFDPRAALEDTRLMLRRLHLVNSQQG
jgi:hypothetical protein